MCLYTGKKIESQSGYSGVLVLKLLVIYTIFCLSSTSQGIALVLIWLFSEQMYFAF